MNSKEGTEVEAQLTPIQRILRGLPRVEGLMPLSLYRAWLTAKLVSKADGVLAHNYWMRSIASTDIFAHSDGLCLLTYYRLETQTTTKIVIIVCLLSS